MDKIINMFESIRDIPYKIPLTIEDNSVDCDKKHKKLAQALEGEGYSVRFRTCSFLWSEQNLPSDILDIKHVDKCEHLFLEILIDGKWNVLDITWDKELQKVLPVCEWNSKKNQIAVKPIEVYSPEYKKPLGHNVSDEAFLEDIRTSGEFYKALNDWLENQRYNN